MLFNHLLDIMQQLKLIGMAEALEEQLKNASSDGLSFEERLGLLLEREKTRRDNRRLKIHLSQAHFKYPNACLEDIDYSNNRIDRNRLLSLSSCNWIQKKRNLLITGATGTGKSYLSCALAVNACLMGYTALYYRLPRLLSLLEISHGDGSHLKKLNALNKKNVLILDDWGITPMHSNEKRDLLELLDDRYEQTSTIVVSQLPVAHWHEFIVSFP